MQTKGRIAVLRILVVEEEHTGALSLLSEGLDALPVERLERAFPREFLHGRVRPDAYHLLLLAPPGDVSDEMIARLGELRRENNRLFIVLALPPGCDLSRYIRPAVQPSGVLFIPLARDRLYAVVREIEAERARTETPAQVFAVKTGGETYYIEVDRICFFEAQNKKIALKTDAQEILFYSSFDKILSQLPEGFVRCHKGFLINAARVRAVNYTEMTVVMRDESVIPVSRTGKQALQEAMHRMGRA